MSEKEMASCIDVLNKELRVNGPIEVEQYKMGQMREGIKKLVDYMRAKIDRAGALNAHHDKQEVDYLDTIHRLEEKLAK